MGFASDVAFTPSVKQVQAERGSRRHYALSSEDEDWPTTVTPNLAAFLAQVRSFYLATASADGQPYIQHRGGPPGFVRVLDEKTLGWADYRGNRQYVTTGNLRDNPRAFLFIMDYANRQRVKLWGTARVIEDDPDLVARLMPEGYKARPEQAILFTLSAWNPNCPQHIPELIPVEVVAEAMGRLEARIVELEAENAALRAERPATP
jgi:predicted pyridoxine 5'-phosphate oxidase superfamily flavin-nucleotide-binding protein